MRVAMYYNNKDIRLEEVPTPTISENEMLLKVHASRVVYLGLYAFQQRGRLPRLWAKTNRAILT